MTIRTMDFDFLDAIAPAIMPGRPEESFGYMGISAILPHLEPYLIRTVKASLDRIQDPTLKEQARRFIAQEGQHYRQHIAFNKAAGMHDVPAFLAVSEEIAETFERYTRTRSLRFNLAYAESFEAATTAVGLAAFKTKVFEALTPEAAEIWQWHLVEEIEHRTVAFDIYQHLVGGYGYRVFVGLLVHRQLANFAIRVARALDRAYPELLSQHGGRSARRRRLWELVRRLGRHSLPRVALTYLPWYSPHKLEVPADILELARSYSAQASQTS